MPPLHTYVKISSRGNRYHSPLELYSSIERKRGGEKKKKRRRIFCESFAKVPTKFPTRNAKGEEQFIFPEELFSCMLRKYPFDQTAPTNRNIVRPTFSIFQLSISFFPSLPFSLSLSLLHRVSRSKLISILKGDVHEIYFEKFRDFCHKLFLSKRNRIYHGSLP